MFNASFSSIAAISWRRQIVHSHNLMEKRRKMERRYEKSKINIGRHKHGQNEENKTP